MIADRDIDRPLHPLDEWVEGVRRGSNAAFVAVYRATADDLLSFANGMLHDRASAEDAVQQAFLELARSSHRFRGDGRALRVWLFKSVRFSCLDELRRAGRRREQPSERLPEQAASDDPADALPDPRLVAALGELSERQRTLVLLKHVSGLSGEELAGVMRMNRPAAYAAVRRAEERLRRLLGEVDDG